MQCIHNNWLLVSEVLPEVCYFGNVDTSTSYWWAFSPEVNCILCSSALDQKTETSSIIVMYKRWHGLNSGNSLNANPVLEVLPRSSSYMYTVLRERERKKRELWSKLFNIFFRIVFLFMSLFPMACVLLTPHKYDDVYMLNIEDLPTNLNNKYHCIENVLACTFLWLWSCFIF